MKVKPSLILTVEIDGTDVKLVPITTKKISIPNSANGSSSSSTVTLNFTSEEVLVPASTKSDKVVGYLLVAPEVTE
jgi:hypothetical protein